MADDSNVPAPIAVKSNVGGKSRSSSSQKEGSVKYMKAQETADQMQLQEGLEINVFADEEKFPEIANPVQMAVDTKGRLWVAAWPTYPNGNLKEMNDALVILPDENRTEWPTRPSPSPRFTTRPDSSSGTAGSSWPPPPTSSSSRIPTGTTWPTSASASCTGSIPPTLTMRPTT